MIKFLRVHHLVHLNSFLLFVRDFIFNCCSLQCRMYPSLNFPVSMILRVHHLVHLNSFLLFVRDFISNRCSLDHNAGNSGHHQAPPIPQPGAFKIFYYLFEISFLIVVHPFPPQAVHAGPQSGAFPFLFIICSRIHS